MAHTTEGTVQIAAAGTDSAANKQLYDAWAPKYEEDVRAWGYQLDRIVAEKVKKLVPAGKEESFKILDAGAGDGLSGKAMADQGLKDLTGIDVSSEQIKLASKKGIYKVAEVVDLNKPVKYKTDEFDAITVVGVMTYLDCDGCCLDEFVRVVKPGGFVVMTHRTDKVEQWEVHQERMEKEGKWQSVEISDSLAYLPNNPEYADKILVKVYIYRVGKKDNVDMKVTKQKSPGFYVKAAKGFFQGVEDSEGNKREPVNQLNISGLGDAINTAVLAALACEGEGLATIAKTNTSYVELESRGLMRSIPAIRISLKKS